MGELTNRLTAVEVNLASLPQLRVDMDHLNISTSHMAAQIKSLSSQCDNLESQSRRSNLIFYGITDSPGETWTASEAKVVSLCQEVLGVEINSSCLERAHRLGAFRANRNRPLIGKFSSFKQKQDILSLGSRLKNTPFSLSEDFSPKIRSERKILLEFAKSKDCRFQLKYNRLHIGDQSFYVDAVTRSVKNTAA